MLTCMKCMEPVSNIGVFTCKCGNEDSERAQLSCDHCKFIYLNGRDSDHKFLSDDNGVTTFCSEECKEEFPKVECDRCGHEESSSAYLHLSSEVDILLCQECWEQEIWPE